MNTPGVIVDQNTVRFERLLAGPIDRVWGFLTEDANLRTWLGQVESDLRFGGELKLQFERKEIPDRIKSGEFISGVIRVCQPPNRLTFTWQDVTPGCDTKYGVFGELPSTVSLELQERNDEVLLVLTHRRLPESAMVGVGAGWHTHLDMLAARLHGEEPPPFLERFNSLLPIYQKEVDRVFQQLHKYVASALVASVVIAAPAIADGSNQHIYLELKDTRAHMVTQIDHLLRERDYMLHEIDSLKRAQTADANQILDRMDRQVKDTEADIKGLDRAVKDLDSSISSMPQ